MKRLLIASLLCLYAGIASSQTSPGAPANTRYIRDSLGVNLRSDVTESSRVVAENLRSGTALQLIETDEKSGASRVRTGSGQEGWLASRFLQKEPTFETKYREAQARLAQLESNGAIQPRITEQPTTDEGLRADNIRLTRELEELKALSGKAVDIDKNNKALIRKNELLQTEVDKLSAENDRLGSQAAREEWIRTLIAIGLGILLTLALPRLIPHKKRYSDW